MTIVYVFVGLQILELFTMTFLFIIIKNNNNYLVICFISHVAWRIIDFLDRLMK